MTIKLFTVLAISAATFATAAPAATVFTGQDDGAAVGGPYTNSAAAEAAFLAAASAAGTVVKETFESRAVGYYSPIAINGGSISVVAPDFGPGFSGVSNVDFGNQYGFNTTAGGSKWLGFPSFSPAGTATFTFNTPTNSFGFYITGVQTEFTAGITVSVIGGSQASFNLPLNSLGGVTYFGFVDSSPFTSISIVNTSRPGQADAWGIDDISYNSGVVPEPASWAMLIAGFGLVGATARRRRTRALAA